MGDSNKKAKDSLTGISFEGAPSGVPSLPGRAEKRIIPVPVQTIDFLNPSLARKTKDWSWRELFGSQPQAGFKENEVNVRASSSVADYEQALARSTFTDYIVIRLKDRAKGTGVPLVFRFLVNPHTINVSRNSIDAQSMTRAGWQLGIWGDDAIDIRLEGVTAGQYFTLGLTNNFSEHTASYRNFMEFVSLFENNGYWFEGEDIDNSTLANDAVRRRIRFHSDVELKVGNFVWSGCFTDLEFTEDADKPFQISFSASFMAWKERFMEASPWRDSLHNNVYRGHAYEYSRNLKQAAQEKKEAEKKAADDAAALAKAKRENDAAAEEYALQQAIATGDTVTQKQIIQDRLNPPTFPRTYNVAPTGLGQIMGEGNP